MVQRQDTSVAPSLRVTCGRVLCLCLRKRQGGPLFLLYCPGFPSIWYGLAVAVAPVAAQPRTASCCKLLLTTIPNPLQAERTVTLPEPILACQTLSRLPVPVFLVFAWGSKPHLNPAASVCDSRPHPLQPFNDPQPTAPPVNCPHFPNRPGAWVPCFLSLPVPASIFHSSRLCLDHLVVCSTFVALLRLGPFLLSIVIASASFLPAGQ